MEIIITTHAQRQLKKLSAAAIQELKAAILGLARWPDVENVIRLKNRPDYRLRVGRWRVLFEVSEGRLFITQVLLRDEQTY